MKCYLLFFLIISYSFSPIVSQPIFKGNNFVKISAGRVLFGTGDIAGYGINLEYSRRLNASNRFIRHFQIGAEASFENGVKNPVIENPTPQEFIDKSFGQYSIALISAKITYYPFRSILNGLNISIGPSIGYMQHSYEARAERVVYTPTLSYRVSTLRFDNRLLIGYRVTTGYELNIIKKFMLGFRLDLSNYDNNDFNTSWAGKIGYNF